MQQPNYYVKRNDYTTVYDDKKLLEKKASPYKQEIEYPTNLQKTAVKTTILPTTSNSYGAHYKFNNDNSYQNKIFY